MPQMDPISFMLDQLMRMVALEAIRVAIWLGPIAVLTYWHARLLKK